MNKFFGLLAGFGGTVLSFFAAFKLFGFLFFTLASYIIAQIPAGAWKGFLSLLTYVLIAYFGGVGIPLLIIVFGTAISLGLAKAIFD